MFRLQLCCSGGTSNLGVDTGLWGLLSFSLHVNGFEGWCSPRCFCPRAASNCCCGDGVSLLVWGLGLRGAYQPSNAHEDSRPVALKTRPSLQKWTNLLENQNGPTPSTTEMNLWAQYCPRRPTRWTKICDYGPSVPTNLTLKILYRVFNLIFNYRQWFHCRSLWGLP